MKKILCLICSLVIVGTIVAPITAKADSSVETRNSESYSGNSTLINEGGEPVLRNYVSGKGERVLISRWGAWQYTNVAVSTGVVANAINAAWYAGIGSVASIGGIPGWIIMGLCGVTSWTQFGSAPGNMIAKKLDKNGNGWVALYSRAGYAGNKIVAYDHKTI